MRKDAKNTQKCTSVANVEFGILLRAMCHHIKKKSVMGIVPVTLIIAIIF